MQFETIEDDEHLAAGSASAERQLWCAVIERALRDALATISPPAECRRVREAARAWFLANGFEYRTVCESAGYDPDYLRSRVLSKIATPS
jgi:hypothetical protein